MASSEYSHLKILARFAQRFIERLPIAHMIGEQQDQLRIQHTALLGIEIAMRIDQGFAEIVRVRNIGVEIECVVDC